MKKIINIILFSILLFIYFFIPTTNQSVFAINDRPVSSDVLIDLQKDENFNMTLYPTISNDYSLQVIQIAETTDKELLIYVYQPAALDDIFATSINISTNVDNELDYHNYKLELLNFNNVYYKYKVDDFIVSSDVNRLYNISSIYRFWNEKYDEDIEEETGNTISEVAYKVGKLYTATTQNDEVSYKCIEQETIRVTDYFVDFIRYPDFTLFYAAECVDSHFVAFSTDINMDRLLKAELSFYAQDYIDSTIAEDEYFTLEQKEVELSYDEVANNDRFGVEFFTYSWKRIQTSEEFLARTDIDLSENTKNNVTNKDWVLSFYETNYTEDTRYVGMASVLDYYTRATKVTEVTILELTFEKDGVVYNLGVVNNKQSGSGNPGGYGNKMSELEKFFALLLLIVVIVIFMPVITALLSFLIWLISALFKLIIGLFKIPFKIADSLPKHKETKPKSKHRYRRWKKQLKI